MGPALRSVSLQGSKMPERLWLLLTLLTLPHCGRSQTLHQTPPMPCSAPRLLCPAALLPAGIPFNPLDALVPAASPGAALHTLVLPRGKDSIDDSSERHFRAARPTQQNFTLDTDGLFPNDTGLYYCAWRRTLSRAGAAPGQNLPLPPPL
ncbi:unnamed protein product [Eretmochelys imbricata]